MEKQSQYYQIIFRILQLAVFCVFIGRAGQHIFWDAPFRTILWNENLMNGFVTNWLSMSWEQYVTSPVWDERIQGVIKGFGFFYLALAILTIFIRQIPRVLKSLLLVGSFSLMILAYIYMQTAFGAIGQFFEYSLQFAAPVFLWIVVTQKIEFEKLLPFLKISIAVTFFCHGLYAVGFYPRPGTFMQMTISTFGCTEIQAMNFLTMVAWLDFLVAGLIFLKPDISFIALVYCVIWGFLTSFARIVGNFYPEFWMETLFKYTPDFLYRAPHFLVPLATIYIYAAKNRLTVNQETVN